MWFLCFFCLNTPYGGRCASILQVFYKDSSAKGTPVVFTPEMERVKRNQENISSVPSEPPPEPAVNLFLTDLSLALVNCINEADVFDSTICSVSAHIITFNLSWWPHYSSSSLQRTEHNSTLNLSLLIHLSEVPVILPVTPCFPLHLYFFRFSVASNAKSYWMMPSGLKASDAHCMSSVPPLSCRCFTLTASANRSKARPPSSWTRLKWGASGRPSGSSQGYGLFSALKRGCLLIFLTWLSKEDDLLYFIYLVFSPFLCYTYNRKHLIGFTMVAEILEKRKSVYCGSDEVLWQVAEKNQRSYWPLKLECWR